MQLYLIRHPEPQIETGVCYGALDVPAKPEAFNHCLSTLIPSLETLGAVPIYTSPLQRCAALAQALHAALPSSTLTHCHALVELDFGRWEGLSWDATYATDSAGLDAWAANLVDHAPSGGESLRTLHARVSRWLTDLLPSGVDTAIVITHGGPLRILLSSDISSPNAALSAKAPAWGSLNIIQIAA